MKKFFKFAFIYMPLLLLFLSTGQSQTQISQNFVLISIIIFKFASIKKLLNYILSNLMVHSCLKFEYKLILKFQVDGIFSCKPSKLS